MLLSKHKLDAQLHNSLTHEDNTFGQPSRATVMPQRPVSHDMNQSLSNQLSQPNTFLSQKIVLSQT